MVYRRRSHRRNRTLREATNCSARSVVSGAARGFGMLLYVVADLVLVPSQRSDVYECIGRNRVKDSALLSR
jgi:hypothetical protein